MDELNNQPSTTQEHDAGATVDTTNAPAAIDAARVEALMQQLAGSPFAPQELREVMPAMVLDMKWREQQRADLLQRVEKLEAAVAAWGG